MKLSEVFTAPNQLTLLRMVFVPFIVIHLVDGHYLWALALFVVAGFSDGLDGLLARRLHQQTLLGQYLDPIADKLLLSTLFLVLSILHKIPWKFTVVVFSRDISILAASAVLFAIAGLRDFRPPREVADPDEHTHDVDAVVQATIQVKSLPIVGIGHLILTFLLRCGG